MANNAIVEGFVLLSNLFLLFGMKLIHLSINPTGLYLRSFSIVVYYHQLIVFKSRTNDFKEFDLQYHRQPENSVFPNRQCVPRRMNLVA